METTNAANESHPTQNKKETLFFVIVLIGFFYGSFFGFLFYALPKFLICKFILKRQHQKYKLIRDTAIAGLLMGLLVWNYNSHQATPDDTNQSTTSYGN